MLKAWKFYCDGKVYGLKFSHQPPGLKYFTENPYMHMYIIIIIVSIISPCKFVHVSKEGDNILILAILYIHVPDQMEQELEHAKRRRKERCSVTPEVEARPDQGQGISDAMSDGYQSDGEASDISSRAEEIAQQVVEDDQCKIIHTVLLQEQ